MANNKGNWAWQPPKRNPTIYQVFAGLAINPCPICGVVGCSVKGTRKQGFTAMCAGCGAGTSHCSTPFNALRVYQATRASV